MTPQQIQLTKSLPDIQVDELAGRTLDLDAFDLLVQDGADVYKPNGDLLLKYRRSVLPLDLCKTAWHNLRNAAGETRNRGMAAGKPEGETSAKMNPVRSTGHVSNTNESWNPVSSGVVGYFDRSPRFPYCRMTAFNIDHFPEYAAALPYVRAVDKVFALEAPERYAAQRKMIEQTSPDFYIGGTVFTTITVNKNFRTAVHKDIGDYKNGFGVMSVLEAGTYRGGFLVFPKYRVAVDMRTAGVCLADVHEWHGNTPIIGVEGSYERISCVFYYREKMYDCGSAADELERVKTRAEGEPLVSSKAPEAEGALRLF